MKKIIIISITVLLILLVTFFGWYLIVKSPDSSAEAIRGILPFGTAGDTGQPTTNPSTPLGASDQSTTDEFGKPTASLFRISMEPVAGAVILNKGTSTVVVRYVDRATGHIYESNLTTLAKTKITNQTLPKIYEAYFRSDGNAVLFRSLQNDSDTVENFSLSLTPPKATLASTSSPQATDGLYTVSATALRGDINAVAVGSGNTLFYALRDTKTLVSSAFNGTGVKTLFTSPFTDWHLVPVGNNLVIYTKASAYVPGYAYTLNTASRTLTKIIGPLNGLTVRPNASGNRILYSYTEGSGTKLFANNLQSKDVSEIFPPTLAEKCVWSVKNVGVVFCGAPTSGLGSGEPDNWYRGATHFSDRIWRFDTNTDIAEVLAEPKQNLDIDIDVLDLKLSPNEDYLIFINKNDLTLWGLKLE
ncbi:MAG: hypothetical protein A3G05_00875 [Candidatus Zambryskibacteria bacterium RIFCSPLOWO2_12_FULL_45_14]|uniref:Protein TolB n=2 Tax=Candidatus Zambryskiibacteriota TaxID=1817925 RepID=A0A1G2UK86_9BACT|nr:MAG: hypothetical protein A3H60_00510 [Candidatus Zambryskibacteria bacterium RIFCSPLOWO2_02_FULL_44_12b]OHB13970.1 MAG: hypothetical protein A3G05_00875 [Candidatus Zambryskibacteria bacterium RIFCSPLOWO2_12_FULL_45_14]